MTGPSVSLYLCDALIRGNAPIHFPFFESTLEELLQSLSCLAMPFGRGSLLTWCVIPRNSEILHQAVTSKRLSRGKPPGYSTP